MFHTGPVKPALHATPYQRFVDDEPVTELKKRLHAKDCEVDKRRVYEYAIGCLVFGGKTKPFRPTSGIDTGRRETNAEATPGLTPRQRGANKSIQYPC